MLVEVSPHLLGLLQLATLQAGDLPAVDDVENCLRHLFEDPASGHSDRRYPSQASDAR